MNTLTIERWWSEHTIRQRFLRWMRRTLGVAAVSATAACATVPTAVTTPVTPPVALVSVDGVACRTPVVDGYCHGAKLAKFTITPTTVDQTPRVQIANDDGYALFDGIPDTWTEVDIDIVASGFEPLETHVTLASLRERNATCPAPGCHNTFQLISKDFDPSSVPLEELAAIRGAMWTARLNLPYGRRPGQDSNILAMDFYGLYGTEDRARMLHQYHDVQGYTDAVTGPVTGNDCYHGLYPCFQGVPSQEQWDAYLDTLQEWWNHDRIRPVFFAKGDGWERPEFAADMDRMDALYSQPRAQRLIRTVAYCGWEPSGSKYGWKNQTYVDCLARGARVFPHALRLLHMVADLDSPIGGDDDPVAHLKDGKAAAWRNVAPYIHGLLVQVGGYVDPESRIRVPQPTPEFLREFAKVCPDFIRRFTTGDQGWPTSSARGEGKRLWVYYAEGASFGDFWDNWPESVALDLGDLAMESGADGYLDGGRVAVPVPVR